MSEKGLLSFALLDICKAGFFISQVNMISVGVLLPIYITIDQIKHQTLTLILFYRGRDPRSVLFFETKNMNIYGRKEFYRYERYS